MMWEYELSIKRFSGDTLGVSTTTECVKHFDDIRTFDLWKKSMEDFDYDGSYAEVTVIRKRQVPLISKELLQHFVDLLNKDGENTKKQVRQEIEYVIKRM